MSAMERGPWVAGLALAAATSWAAPPLEVRHEPVSCVAVDRYLRVSAAGVPAEEVARAVLMFRADASTGWYTTPMTLEPGGEDWTAYVPGPLGSLGAFEYRVVLYGRDVRQAGTAVQSVNVVPPENCMAPSRTDLDAPIVVRVPSGAPPVPPVPAGFSPTGVVAAAAAPKPASGTSTTIVPIVGVAAATAALVISGGGDTPDTTESLPAFALNTTQPRPGTSFSLASTQFRVEVLMSREPEHALALQWQVDLQNGGVVCALMADTFNGAKTPLSLVFTAPLASTGACGSAFDVTSLRLRIQVNSQPIHDATHGIPYHIEP